MSPTNNDAAVVLESLTKTFGDHRAVDGLSLRIPRGAIFGLLGRNGAGKTTTIRMLMDIIRPDTGSISILGRSMDDATKDRTGYLPEERGLYQKMKVIEVLEFQGALKGLAASDARSRGKSWLERLELAEWTDHKVEDLSKGMQQKVQFIGAVLHKPDLLILDEPFSGMDPVNQEILKDLILETNRDGCTIVFSTHVMDSAERLCHEIVLIDRGRAILEGPLSSIKQRFGTNAVEMAFTGDGSFLKSLPGVERVLDNGQQFEIRLSREADPQTILRASVEHLTVHRFQVVTPTLHSIFIEQVGRERTAEAPRREATHA